MGGGGAPRAARRGRGDAGRGARRGAARRGARRDSEAPHPLAPRAGGAAPTHRDVTRPATAFQQAAVPGDDTAVCAMEARAPAADEPPAARPGLSRLNLLFLGVGAQKAGQAVLDPAEAYTVIEKDIAL